MVHRKYDVTKKTVMNWVEQHECVRVWLSKLNGTKRLRALCLWYYCDWAKKSPEELLALKSGFECLDAERLLDRFVVDAAKYPESTRWKSVLSVKSFYRCNYRQLQAEAGKIEYYQVKTQRLPSKRKRLELYQACFNPRNRALVCMVFCSALATDTLSRLKWEHFEEDWMRQEVPHISVPPELLKGHGRGRYKGVRQETFLTPECKRELVKYRRFMEKRYGVLWSDDMHVLLTLANPPKPMCYSSITSAITRISSFAKVGFSVHDGRRIVQTALESVGTPRNWIRKIKGRKLRGEESPYSKPAVEQLRSKYREALDELEFLGGASEGGGLTGEQQRVFHDLVRVLERYPEKAEKFERFLMDL